MRISDWSSDVCSSDLIGHQRIHGDSGAIHACSNIDVRAQPFLFFGNLDTVPARGAFLQHREHERLRAQLIFRISGIACIEYDRKLNSRNGVAPGEMRLDSIGERSEEHTSELQSLMRISYAVFCLKKKKKN